LAVFRIGFLCSLKKQPSLRIAKPLKIDLSPEIHYEFSIPVRRLLALN
jgi:hypothetical protein